MRSIVLKFDGDGSDKPQASWFLRSWWRELVLKN